MNDILHAALLTASHEDQPQVHDHWEFIFCLSGGGEYAFGGQKLSFTKGDMIAVPPLTPHASLTDTCSELIQLHISQPFLLLKKTCVIHSDGSPHLQNAFEAALYHYRSGLPAKNHLLTAYGGLIVCYLAAFRSVSAPSPIVVEIELAIRSRYTDPAFELEAYLRSLPFNYDYLRKLFQREMSITPHQYLNNLRLHTAAEALLNAEGASGSVTDIARMCGFREPLYFSRMFKKKYGLSPTYYAASAAGKSSPTPDSEEA
jgi:AraC-like DNA-binding protein